MELQDQLLDEEAEGVRVSVGLANGHVAFTFRADRSDDRQSRGDGALLDGVAVASDPPLLIPEITFIQSTLVDIYDNQAFVEKTEHAFGELLSDYERAVRVALERNFLDFPVPHMEHLAHNTRDKMVFDVNSMRNPDSINDLLPSPNVLIFYYAFLDLNSNCHLLLKFPILFQLPFGDRIIMLVKVSNDSSDESGCDVERNGDLRVAVFLNGHGLDYESDGSAVYLISLPPFLKHRIWIIKLLLEARIIWLLLLLRNVTPSQCPWHFVDDGLIEIIIVQVDS